MWLNPCRGQSVVGCTHPYKGEWEKKKNDKDKFKYAAGVRRRLMSMLPDAPKIEDAEEQQEESDDTEVRRCRLTSG